LSNFIVPTDEKYPLVTPKIEPGVIVEGDMLRKITSLNFADHNIIDENKSPKLAQEKYLCI
jgi:hypothetical protein